MVDKDLFILLSQYHGCWWPGDARSQVISSHGVENFSEYSSFRTIKVNYFFCWYLDQVFIIAYNPWGLKLVLNTIYVIWEEGWVRDQILNVNNLYTKTNKTCGLGVFFWFPLLNVMKILGSFMVCGMRDCIILWGFALSELKINHLPMYIFLLELHINFCIRETYFLFSLAESWLRLSS